MNTARLVASQNRKARLRIHCVRRGCQPFWLSGGQVARVLHRYEQPVKSSRWRELASRILTCMEAVLSTGAAFARYGSARHKHVYIYGGLDRTPITLTRGPRRATSPRATRTSSSCSRASAASRRGPASPSTRTHSADSGSNRAAGGVPPIPGSAGTIDHDATQILHPALSTQTSAGSLRLRAVAHRATPSSAAGDAPVRPPGRGGTNHA